ncbi:ATP-binding protein [Candidatus Parcubacteria bacterium]|nr:MAG: ATP-binding protein [Candidatus Parcubacteria bacterium]
MIKRNIEKAKIEELVRQFPVTAILGPRQCGKTTLAREFEYSHYFDLENPRDLVRFDNPQLTLEELKGLIVIDEIQRKPELFPLLRYLTDTNKNQKYLILGSASRALIKQSGETLAGRIAYYYLSGFNIDEVGVENIRKLWLRGGFPSSFLAENESYSFIWREQYITTFLERDVPQLGINIPPNTLRRFWIMLSHYHGSIVNFSEIGRSFGISDFTVRKYIEILENAFTVRLLQPWYQNVNKRLVKRPKLYIRDSGIFHALQSIESYDQLLSHPKLGMSWEGFALENVISHLKLSPEKIYFWRTHNGAEVDLFWQKGGKNWAIEFKFADSPRMTKSIRAALNDLELEHLWVVYPGKEKYKIDERVSVYPISLLPEFNN